MCAMSSRSKFVHIITFDSSFSSYFWTRPNRTRLCPGQQQKWQSLPLGFKNLLCLCPFPVQEIQHVYVWTLDHKQRFIAILCKNLRSFDWITWMRWTAIPVYRDILKVESYCKVRRELGDGYSGERCRLVRQWGAWATWSPQGNIFSQEGLFELSQHWWSALCYMFYYKWWTNNGWERKWGAVDKEFGKVGPDKKNFDAV